MFPNIKIKKILGIVIKKEPDGWEDLGQVCGTSIIKDGEIFEETSSHGICMTTVRIGREKGKIFLYCPRCMIKTNYNKTI